MCPCNPRIEFCTSRYRYSTSALTSEVGLDLPHRWESPRESPMACQLEHSVLPLHAFAFAPYVLRVSDCQAADTHSSVNTLLHASAQMPTPTPRP